MMVRVMLAIIALIFGAGSLAMSVLFASTLGEGYAQLLWIVVAVGACASKLVMPAAFDGVPWHKSKGLRVSFVVAFIVDFAFTGGFAASSRDVLAENLQAEATARAEQVQRVDAARTALAQSPPGRSAEVVRADLGAAKRLTKGCRPGMREATEQGCLAVAALEREEAGNTARARLQLEFDAADDRLAKMKEVIVYPEAHRIARGLRSIGVDGATDERVFLALSLLIVLLFEVASVSAARAALVPPMRSTPEPLPAARPPATARAPRVTRSRGSANHAPAVLAALSDAAAGRSVPGVTRDASGVLHLSQRALHQHLNVPGRQLSAALASLQAAGRAQVSSGPGGTAVRLVGKIAAI